MLQQCLYVPLVRSESQKGWFLSSPFLRFLFYSLTWFLQITYWPEDTVATGSEPLCFPLPCGKTSVSAPIFTSFLTVSEEDQTLLVSQSHLPLCLQGPNSITPPPPNFYFLSPTWNWSSSLAKLFFSTEKDQKQIP